MILTIANQKGGVGKTTTTMNLGAALARLGKKVLLIDSDPQANLTSYLGVEEITSTLDELYLSKKTPTDLSPWIHDTRSGVQLIPGEGALSGVDYYLVSRPDKETVLRNALAGLKSQYDFILIDTPPALNLLTINALVASDRVLIPIQPEFFSLEGVVKIRTAIEDLAARWNPELKVLGVVANQVTTRRKLTTEVLAAVAGEFEDLFFDTKIRNTAAIAESSGQGRSVIEYDQSSHGSQDFSALAQELLAKI